MPGPATPWQSHEGPGPVPHGWERMRDPESNAYFYVNHELKVKSMLNPWMSPDNRLMEKSDDAQRGLMKPNSTTVMSTGSFVTGQGSPQLATGSVMNDVSNRDIAAQDRWSHVIQADAGRQVNVLEPRIVTVAADGDESLLIDSKFPVHRSLSNLNLEASMQTVPRARRSPPTKIGSFAKADRLSPPRLSHSLHSVVETDYPALYSTMSPRERKLQPSISARAVPMPHRVGDGGGIRMIDRRHDARSWRNPSPTKSTSDLTSAPKYMSSPAVLDARGQRTSSSINSRIRLPETEKVPLTRRFDTVHSIPPAIKVEAVRRYQELYGSANHSLYGSSRVIPENPSTAGDLHASYTEELRRRADPMMSNRSYWSLSHVGASMDYGRDCISTEKFRDVPISRSLDSQSLANYYQRFENFGADFRLHGQSREAEKSRLASFSQRQESDLIAQRGVLESLQQSFHLSQLQHQDLCARFEELMMNNHLLLDKVRANHGDFGPHPRSWTPRANADTLSSERQEAHVTRVPLITIPLEKKTIPSTRLSTNSLPSSAVALHFNSPRVSVLPMRRSLDGNYSVPRQATEQEVIARMQMHFQEEILYAHALAQQERQRSNELMSQILALQMRQDSERFSGTEYMSDQATLWNGSTCQVSVDTLIEEYAGAYAGQEPRANNGMAYYASGPSQMLDASSYEMRLRGLSGIISNAEMDSIMKLEAMEHGIGVNAIHEPLDETHTWQHVTSLPLSQQPSGTNSYSSVQLDGVSATIEEDLTLSAKVSKTGLNAGRASVRSGVEPEEVDEDSSSEDEPTQSEATSRTVSSANPDSRNTPVDQQDGPPSMWGNGPLFPRD